MYKLLIVEDDMIITHALEKHLTKWGYDVKIATDFNNVIDTFINYKPELIFLDINSPSFDGYYWCNEIRKLSNIPIVFISSTSEHMNILLATNMGADDFITKPLDLDILSAKVQALLRKSSDSQNALNVLKHRDVTLNLNDATLSYHGQKLELTKNDFRILQLLLKHSGTVVSRNDIMLHLWKNKQFIDDNTLTVNMTRLRKKLSTIGLNRWIITKKGVGYIIL